MNNEPPEKLQIRSLLKEKEFHFKKKWGQNFIFDLNLLRRIVEVAGIQAGDRVVEIGPGAGTLTRMLLEKGAEVLAVEIDAALLPVLAQVLDGTRGIVVQGDALKVNFDEMTANHNMAPPYKVVANLPYYITTPLIMSLLENHDQIADIVVMVQKEVAERLTASPGTKEYGAVTLAVEYYAEAEILFNIPRRLFIPVPEVDSALLRLKPRAERRRDILPGEELQTRERLFKLIKAAFGQRRKTLLNALSSLVKGLNKEKIVAMLEKGGIDPQTRGETLSLTQYEQLAVIWAEMDKQEEGKGRRE
ncbi:MAG: 16S rRNA (adenine(1518)-N(6)/adenine(1519)-N(6))-dimethyltransferase RsmA [Peptococcia bacterium]|jgi:16S rRNA (adenine1518-N6/adenine1519-N6)-dimethyltransferase